jgi:hypothetical protein
MIFRRTMIVVGALVALVTAILVGCNALIGSYERKPDEVANLHASARALVPPGATVVAERESACYRELAAQPECVVIDLAGAGSFARRVDSIRRLAAANGWRQYRVDTASTRTALSYRREGLDAWISIKAHDYGWSQLCKSKPLSTRVRETCEDHIRVRFD